MLLAKPAAAGSGITFSRCGARVSASAGNVVSTERCTTLGYNGTTVATVEHLLSALYACRVDNALICLDGPEVPIMDGSTQPFCVAIRQAGTRVLDEPAPVLRLESEIEIRTAGSSITVTPADSLSLEVSTSFDGWAEGAATIRVELDQDGAVWQSRIEPARTFAFRHEVDALLAAGLAKGGSLDNALVITPPDEFSSPLRVEAEWCAHKAADLLGDLALVGARLQAHVRAVRPGHTVNCELARTLLAMQASGATGQMEQRL